MAGKKLKPQPLIVLLIIICFMSLSYIKIPFFERLEKGLYRIENIFSQADEQNTDIIVLVDIDKKSMAELGPWPWPRNIIAEMVKGLGDSGVRVTGLNVPFNDRENPAALNEISSFSEKFSAYPPADGNPALKKWVVNNLNEIKTRLDNDTLLTDHIRQAGNVILPLMEGESIFEQENDNPDKNPLGLNSYLKSSGLSPSLHSAISITDIVYPLLPLMENAAGLGHTDMKPVEKMPDGSHRIFMSHNGSLIPSFPLRLVMHFNGIQPDQASVQNDRIILNEEILPLIGGAILTHGAGDKDAFKRLSFSTLLNSKELISGLRDKIVIIGIEKPVDPYKHNGAAGDRSASHRMASVTRDILNNSLVSRPAYIPYVETLFLVFLTMVLLIFFNHRNNSIRLSGIFLLLILTIATATLFLSIMDIWFKSIYIIGSLVTAFLYLSTESRLQPKGKTGESRETTRLLGLNFQSQGLLDLAFDKFKSLPLDKEVKDLIYNLGADYEEKGLSSKAVAVYEYINRQGGFRDLDERIATLKAVENTLDGSEEYEIDKETTMVTETESKTPRMVGRYKILGQLGRGSMGLVYKAQDPKINRVVAIKTIRFSDEFDEDVIYQIKERFFSEAEIAGKLSHPAIVTIHDVGDDNDLTYMAMEYLEGQSLEAFIEKKNLLPFRTVLDIVKEIAEALDFAHQAGVIHRDIKPANVMLLENGHVKVTDFGIAKAISSSRTKTGVILGTPNYMSPEQIMGQKINSKSDIFSLGVVFYQLITGELPFHGDNLSGLLYQITQVKHPSPRSYNQRLPKVCEQIIDKAMAKAPDKRFRTAGDLARIISALADKIDQIRAQRAS